MNKSTKYHSGLRLILVLFSFVIYSQTTDAQSTNPSYPTPISGNELTGKIAARVIGDPRLTSFYYVFDGNQGDLFINVVTTNLDADIDVFTADGLKPLTKIKTFSDAALNETGRVIYLRKRAKLILRVEGRSPNDDPALFKIKFAGSFLPLENTAQSENIENPQVKSQETGKIQVNSIGTIIEKPQPLITSKEKSAEKVESNAPTQSEQINKPDVIDSKNSSIIAETNTVKSGETETREIVVNISDKIKGALNVEEPAPQKKLEAVAADDQIIQNSANNSAVNEKTIITIEKSSEGVSQNTAEIDTAVTKTIVAEAEKKPITLDNVRLLVVFKDGTKIERTLGEIKDFSVNNGFLVITSKEGSVGRYSIFDVERIIVQ